MSSLKAAMRNPRPLLSSRMERLPAGVSSVLGVATIRVVRRRVITGLSANKRKRQENSTSVVVIRISAANSSKGAGAMFYDNMNAIQNQPQLASETLVGANEMIQIPQPAFQLSAYGAIDITPGIGTTAVIVRLRRGYGVTGS